MERTEVHEILRTYVTDDLLHGMAAEIDGRTPLLEWGVIDSLRLLRLVGFIESRFGVIYPTGHLVRERLRTLDAMTDTVMALMDSPGPRA